MRVTFAKQPFDGVRSMSSTSYPQKVQIETFHGCNARCPMCTSDKWERKSGMMSDAVFSRIIEEVIPIKKHLRVVSLFGDGEPLLDKRFAQRVELCKQNDLPNVGATSNASLLSEVKSRDILNAGMDWITFSIDSVDKGSYEKIRVQLDFETVMANISRHIGLRNQLHPSSKIILRFSEQPENYGQFQKLSGKSLSTVVKGENLNKHVQNINKILETKYVSKRPG